MDNDTFPKSLKKLLILTSNGGTGQQSITRALTDYLKSDYKIVTLNVTVDLMKKFDPISYVHKRLNTEVVYNWLIQQNYLRLLNLFVAFGALLFKLGLGKILQTEFKKIYATVQPDVIISLVPFYNAYALSANQNYNKPFLLIVCDTNIKSYFFDWSKSLTKNLHVFLPTKFYQPKNLLMKKHIPLQRQYYFGYPLREQFLKIQAEPQLPFTVTLLLGGQGSNKALNYCKKLLKIPREFIVNVCIGYNKKLKTSLQYLNVPNTIQLNIIEFTPDIATIISLSHVLITKTGSSSIYEALQLKIPILMDCTGTVLNWEKANIKLVEDLKVGIAIRNLQQIKIIIQQFIDHPDKLTTVKRHYQLDNPPAFLPQFKNLLTNLTL